MPLSVETKRFLSQVVPAGNIVLRSVLLSALFSSSLQQTGSEVQSASLTENMAAFTQPLPLCTLSYIPISYTPLCDLPRCRRSTTPTRRCRPPKTTVCQLPNDQNPVPEGKVITRALELSFRAVWVHLVTQGVGQAYEAAIQEFVIACIAAFKAGYSLTALQFELSNNEIQYKNTGLTEKEKETRLTWITLVYLTLQKVAFKSEKAVPKVRDDLGESNVGKMVNGLTGLVENVVEAARKGFDLQRFKMELSLRSDTASDQLSGAEISIRSQWSRIVFMTVKVLPEELTGVPKTQGNQ